MLRNKSTIIYDNTLFAFLDKLKEKHNIKNYSEFGFSESRFNAIWDDINKNINSLNHSEARTTGSNKPNNFAIFMALMCDYSNKPDRRRVLEDDYKFNEGHGETLNCCCNHGINNIFTITNSTTNIKVVVGVDCVTKYMVDNPSIQEQVKVAKSALRKKADIKRKNKKAAEAEAERQRQEWLDEIVREEQEVADHAERLGEAMLSAQQAGARYGYCLHPTYKKIIPLTKNPASFQQKPCMTY